MRDSIHPSNIGIGDWMVAGYVDGTYAWAPSEWDLFPNQAKVRIAVFPWTNDGHVLDCENGDATPAQCPGWVTMRRRSGLATPTVYCSYYAWPSVRKAFADAGVMEPQWWISGYPSPVAPDGSPVIPEGAVAHQWIDRGPYDESIVADYWPGVDPSPNENEDDMAPTRTLFLANSPDPKTPALFPHGVWRDEYADKVVMVGLASDAEQANLLTAYPGTPTIWVEQVTLAEWVRLSRVGVDTPIRLSDNITTEPAPSA